MVNRNDNLESILARLERAIVAAGGGRKTVTSDSLYYALRNTGLDRERAVEVMKLLASKGVFPLPAIIHMELFLTEACNLACTYCFVEGKNNKNRMDFETARRSIDFLLEHSKDARDISVVFFGGEPLLEYDLIREIVFYTESATRETGKKVRFDTTSNGLLLSEDRSRFLAEHGVRVLLSIDGEQEVHDTYRRTIGDKPTFQALMEQMRVLKKYQPYIGAKITVMPEFAGSVDAGVRGLWKSGVEHFIIGHASSLEWSVTASEEYGASLKRTYDWWRREPPSRRPKLSFIDDAVAEQPKNLRHSYGCRAGRTGITLNCRGDIYACAKMLGANGLSGLLPLGTLDDGITEMETRLELCGVIPPDRPGCWGCQNQSRCYGGCYAVNITTTGDPYKSGPECKMVTAAVSVEDYIRRQSRIGRSRVSLGADVFARA